MVLWRLPVCLPPGSDQLRGLIARKPFRRTRKGFLFVKNKKMRKLHVLFAFAALAASVVLSGCGSGGSDDAGSAAKVAPPANDAQMGEKTPGNATQPSTD